QPFPDPLPLSLLKLVVKDRYVDFDKVYGGFTGPTALQDDTKDFGTEFTLVHKDQVVRSIAITTEAQWIRCFEAWLEPLLVVYPHRKEELAIYRSNIMEYFRSGDPSIAIRIDKDARSKAANSPFDLSSQDNFRTLLLKELLHVSSKKRSVPAPTSTSPASSSHSAKRLDTPCILWNEDRCSEPCKNNRKHGYCSECGEQHKAIDSSSCYTKLTTRR
ncbi:hypothetical protein BT96DRAFT_800015, partial [Gymnopus androsaceus JB14]